ncbi:MAG: CotH kinase family protein [Planctomycetes bacterium]|nr:CotH kinase family protein [Planctomycetota bacterium]
MAVLFGGGILITILAGIANLSWYGRERILPVLQNAVTWMQSIPATPRELSLEIKFKDYQKLAFFREEAIKFGKLVQREDSFVPAVILLPDRRVKAKVRLKGGALDHLDGHKWSLRIKIRGDDAVFGMTFFTIQDPVRSSFAYEWVFHEMMRREGLIAPRYDFIHVKINGKPMGIYALEESFSKEMLAAHERREGPIVRLNESFLFVKDRPSRQNDGFFASDVDAFQSEKTKSDPILADQFAIARGLLRDFRDQRLSVGQVFDLDRTATSFALIDLCAAGHACRWKNIRFYYNPITSLLEPIPYNAYSARSAGGARVGSTPWLGGQFIYSDFHVTQWMDAFFKDPTFYKAYVGALDRVSQPTYLKELFADIGPALEKKLRIIHKDDPAFRFSRDYLVDNSNLIRNAVRPVLPLRVRWNPDERRIAVPQISVANTLRLAVELIDITDAHDNRTFEFQTGVVIGPKTADLPRDVSIPLGGLASEAFHDFADDRFTLHYRMVGMTDRYSASVRSHDGAAAKNLPQRARAAEDAFRQMEMFRIDDEQGTIRIEPGTWQVDRTVYVPRGFTLIAGSGVRIHLSHGASIISYSPVSLVGDRDHPIVVQGVGESGGGFVVLQAEGRSTFRHVRFENLGQPTEGSWHLTGGVTFYESPLEIHDCRFLGGRAEDQLNIIRSRFTVANCRFDSAFGDALDIDFGRGEVRDCRFTRSSNDAIDLCGSEAVIERCSISHTGDKAISAGESSRINVADLVIDDSRFGLVSKDLSSLVAHRVTFRTTDTALATYQKKPEYGPATITIDSVTTDAAEPTLLIETGSWIEMETHRHWGHKLDVARSLDGS